MMTKQPQNREGPRFRIILAYQRKAADYLNRRTRHWNKGRQLFFLYLFCGAFTAGIVINGLFYPSRQRHILPAIRLPPPVDTLCIHSYLNLKK